MPYDLIQGQGHRGPKVEKMPISKSVSSAGMHVIKRLMVNCDSARQYLIFPREIFDICPCLASRDLQS